MVRNGPSTDRDDIGSDGPIRHFPSDAKHDDIVLKMPPLEQGLAGSSALVYRIKSGACELATHPKKTSSRPPTCSASVSCAPKRGLASACPARYASTVW